MSVAGRWKNSYGSVMVLGQEPDGRIFGTYQSSTGAAGTYLVAGYANPVDKPGIGESLALSIFWRSIDGEKGNPTWHWVSGLGGQQVASDPPTLELLHAMVATTDDTGLADAGTYLDKLIYLPDPGDTRLPSLGGRPRGAADPVDGRWICREDPAVVLTLEVTSPEYGVVAGSLRMEGGVWEVAGFTDTYAAEDGVRLQGLSVCALLGGSGRTIALAGSLDREDGLITVTGFKNHGTASDSTYVQTKLSELTFVRG